MRYCLPAFLLLFLCFSTTAQPSHPAPAGTDPTNTALLQLIQSFARTSAVTGREDEAASFVKALFTTGALKQDRLGNLVLTLGSGAPKRLFAVPLDEPGYVVSNILDNGYLRITPLGAGQGTMFHQFLQGNEICINTAQGPRYGVAVVPSAHFDRLRMNPESKKPVHEWQETFIDVGCSSAEEVAAKGIRLLDPLTPNKKPQIIGGQSIAAYAAKSKAAVIALATVARTLASSSFSGTVVIAFTRLDGINGQGLADVENKVGPFDEIVRYDRTANTGGGRSGAGASRRQNTQPQSGTTTLVGLPARYSFTPVEMVEAGAVRELIDTWLNKIDPRSWTLTVPPLPSIKPSMAPATPQSTSALAPPSQASASAATPSAPPYQSFSKENALLAKLISLYGVSDAETPVHDFILSALPKWAKPITDEKGNILITFGKGAGATSSKAAAQGKGPSPQHIAFVAHMDEVGYTVDSIGEDGRLQVKQKGGFLNFVWEGHAAIVHVAAQGATPAAEIPALFEPRPDYMTATQKTNGNKAPTVYAGFTSRQQALDAGVKAGITTVTMPKQMIRLSENKATARGFDDRAGCASLLLALQSIDPDKIPFKVTFVWSTGEEAGLTGSTFAAKGLQDCNIVYPIDTYVSSDDPVEPRIFGYCPLGKGAVIRVLESINIVRPKDLAYLQALATRTQVRTQVGMTAGGTDGQGFLAYDIPSVPLSWPGRYSHSPIEILDFRDLKELVALIRVIMMDGTKKYD